MKRLLAAGLLTFLLAQPAWSKVPALQTDYLGLETAHVLHPGQSTLGLGLGFGLANAYAVRYHYGIGHSELSATVTYSTSVAGFQGASDGGVTLGWKHAIVAFPLPFAASLLAKLGYGVSFGSSALTSLFGGGLAGVVALPLTWDLGLGYLTLEPGLSWQGRDVHPFAGLGFQWNLASQWQLRAAAQAFPQPFVSSAINGSDLLITTLPQVGLRYAPTEAWIVEVAAGIRGLDPAYQELPGLMLGTRYAF